MSEQGKAAFDLDGQEREILDWVDGRADHMIDTVKRWSNINSGSRNPEGLGDHAQPSWLRRSLSLAPDQCGRARPVPDGRAQWRD
jgi:hypothetical protein